jgi:hypothetical protein
MTETRDQRIERAIREAYAAEIAYRPAGATWISLTCIREDIAGTGTRYEIDEVLIDMARRDATLVPENNQKILTEADRGAAIRTGGQDKHLLAIEGA